MQRQPSISHRIRQVPFTLGVMVAMAMSVTSQSFAADEPERHPSPNPPQADLVPDLPETPAVLNEMEPLRLIEVTPTNPDDKGSSYTDMGLGRTDTNVLTDSERALLSLARAAIEASRAAGTLEVMPAAERTFPTPLDPEAVKLERMRTMPVTPPVHVAGDPNDAKTAAGSSPEFTGPVLPTPEELEKLEAVQGRNGVVVLEPAKEEAK